MSEPYFPWRTSHQLHCSRKSWSVLSAKNKKQKNKKAQNAVADLHLCGEAARWPFGALMSANGAETGAGARVGAAPLVSVGVRGERRLINSGGGHRR